MESMIFKEGLELSPFDNNSKSNSYLLSYKGRYWKVSSFVACVYEAVKETKNENSAYEYVCNQSNMEIPHEKFDQIVEFYKKNGLFEGYEDVQFSKKVNTNLWGRIVLIPEHVVNKLKIFGFLFDKRVMIVLGIMELLIISYFFLTYNMQLIMSDFWSLKISEIVECILVIIALGLVHELGHSCALMRYGQRAGAIGIGVYLYMPVFFSNVTNAWKLKRMKRVCIDMGGMYFQALGISLLYIIVALLASNSVIKIAIIVSTLQIVGNFNPFIKMDGYWVICDFLGVSNPYEIIKEEIKNIFRKDKVKTEFSSMKTGIKCLFGVYAIFIILYFTYFIRLLIYLFITAIARIVSDISQFKLSIFSDLSFDEVIGFFQARLALYLVLFFVFRLVIHLLKKSIQRRRRK